MEQTISFICSATALALYSASYFFKTKKAYLTLQIIGNIFLSLSYLLIGAIFTMVTVIIGIGRGLVCYYYEKKDREVPLYMIIALCAATISSYVVINFIILKTATSWDVLYMLASCFYAITFTIRNIKLMRYAILVPHALAITYNLVIRAPITSALSYVIEAVITIVAIIKFRTRKAK
ncbi:MAG: YgjV family protein [Clostridia bacterium]|nr:YgjV family protein [Clostridia bacterium]